MTNLPPDAALVALANNINARLNGARVNFYRIQDNSGGMQHAVVLQCGGRRDMLGLGDVYTCGSGDRSWHADVYRFGAEQPANR